MAGRRFLTLCALLACVAAGCSAADSEAPENEATPSATTSSSEATSANGESAGPTEKVTDVPVMPGRAEKNTLKGAEAFVRHYIDLRNHASRTGDAIGLRRFSRNCEGCETYADLYESTYTKGGYIKSSGWSAKFVQAYDLGASTAVFATVAAPRMRYKRDAKDRKHIGRGGRYKLRFEVERDGSRWVVTSLGVQDDDR